MHLSDKEAILDMMRTFYSSPAVYTNGSEEIFLSDFNNCINDNPYIEGYVFQKEHTLLGYAMLAKSFSTEFGKLCIWIEDLYFKPQYRGQGIGNMFFDYIFEKYKEAIFRLELEEDNEYALRLYKKKGFTIIPYIEMKR